jgi:hypothetical protein
VTVRDGVVTLSGSVQHEYQKRAAVHACRATSGVRMVVDNLQAPGFQNVWSTKKEWEPAKPKPAEPNPVAPTAEPGPAPDASAEE